MVGRTCPNCGHNSYSAYASSVWICPYCGNEIPWAEEGEAAECGKGEEELENNRLSDA